MINREIERRFLVTGFDPKKYNTLFWDKIEPIEQGYLELPSALQSLRIRISDGKIASMTIKTGSGEEREEITETLINQAFIENIMESCHHAFRKTRYHKEGWEIDCYAPPLSGIVIAEYEAKVLGQELRIPLYLADSIEEVTHSITNLHLARLATDLRGGDIDPTMALYSQLLKPIPRIVLTGGPCSGKSSIMEILRSEMPDVHFVPEVATLLINQIGIKPFGDDSSGHRFNLANRRIQQIFHTTSVQQAIAQGKKAVVFDRGSVDTAAYLTGGLEEYDKIFRTDFNRDYQDYDLVIFLDIPSREIFEQNKANNPARSETYGQSCLLSIRVNDAWCRHSNFHCVPDQFDNWNRKVEMARNLIRSLI